MMSDLYDPAFPTGDDDDGEDLVGHHTKELRKSQIISKEKTGTMVIAESCTELQKSGECDQFTNNELQNELRKSTHLLQEVNNFNGVPPVIGGNCDPTKNIQGKVDQLPLSNLDTENIPVNRDHSYSRKICPEFTESVLKNSTIGNDKRARVAEITRCVSPPLVENASSTCTALTNGGGEVKSLGQATVSKSTSKDNIITPSQRICDVEKCQKSPKLDDAKKIEMKQEASEKDFVDNVKKEPQPLDQDGLQTSNNTPKEVLQTNSDGVVEASLVKIKQEPLDLPESQDVKEEPPESKERDSQSTPDNNKKKHRRGGRNSAGEQSCGSPNEDFPVRRSSRIRSLEQKKETKGTCKTKESKESAKKEDSDKKGAKMKKEPAKDPDIKKEVVQECEAVSEAHSETVSEVHSEAVSEVHNETVSEVHNETVSELHSESVSELHSETVSELHSETSSSNEATIDKEDDAESADGKGDQKENSRAVSPVSSVSSDCKARQSPTFDIKREEDFMIKPEKVKSRWRRNSELERGGVSTRSTPVRAPEILDGKTTSLRAKDSIILEEPPVLEPAPTVLPEPQPMAAPVQPVPMPAPVPPKPLSVSVPVQPKPISVPVQPVQPIPVAVKPTPMPVQPMPIPAQPVPPATVPTAPVEKLPQFDLIDENIYLFERKRSKSKKEVRRMVCDCGIIKEEIEYGLTGCGEDCLNRLLMIECGSRCALGDTCGNKRFQKKQFSKTEPFKTEKKGFGLRALEDISVGTFVMEYVGEVLSYPDFKQRVKQYAREKNDHYYFMALKSDEIIDATCKGSMSRFINHSCEPNCETQKWTVNGELRIGFFTTLFVKAGQELTFDYQFQRYGREAQKCFCESSKCRGFIGEDKQISLKSNKAQKKRRAVEEKKRDALEDLMLQDELDKLSEKGGLKNQEDTLMLARLMVRAEEVNTRLQLLDIIQNTSEPACMRLFLDYHGLPLIWSWMVDISDGAWELKTKILQVLALLPIPNKTMLQDSKVMNVVQRWALQAQGHDKTFKEKEELSSSSPPSGATTPGHGDSIENLASLENVQPAKRTKHEDSVSDSDGCEVAPSSSDETERTFPPPRGRTESVAEASSPLVLASRAMDLVKRPRERDSVERTESDASDRVSSTVSGEEGASPSGVRTDDVSVKSDEESGDAMEEFGDKKDLKYPNLAAKLLESWTLLKEVFRIPRLERQKRKEDELAAGQQDLEWRNDWECDSRDRYRDRKRGRYRDDSDWEYERKICKEERNHRYSSDEYSESKPKRPPLLPTPPQLSKQERRQLFAMEVQQRDQEEAMRRQQEELEMSLMEEQQQQQQQGMEMALLEYPPQTALLEYPPQTPLLEYPPQTALLEYPPQTALLEYPQQTALLEYPPQTFLVDPNVFQPLPQYEMEPQLYDPTAVAFIAPTMLSDAQLPVPMTSSPVLPVNSPLEVQVNQLRSTGLLPNPTFVDVCTSSIPLPPPIHMPFQDPNQPHVYQQPPVGMVYATNPTQVPYAATPVPTTIVDVVHPFPPPLQPVVASPSPVPTIPPPIPSVPQQLASPAVLASPQAPVVPVGSIPPSTLPSPVAPNFVPGQPSYIAHQSTSLYYVQSNGAVVTLADQSQMPVPGSLPLVHVAVAQAPSAEESRVPSPPKTKPSKLPPNWRTAKDDEGNVYYYHSVTRQTQWDPPPLDEEEENDDMDLGTPTFDEPKVQKYLSSQESSRSSSHKRHSKKKTTTAAADTSSEVAKKIKELFRTKMSSYIVQCLNPYRKPDCRVGRISCTEDFKHLARKLTHFVMSKELKHCKNVEDLECNENVKHKAKEFVHKYMSRYGSIYRKEKGSPKDKEY